MSTLLQPGKLVSLRGRDWVVLPSDSPDLLVVKPLGGSDEETTGIYLPLELPDDFPQDATFAYPMTKDLGDISDGSPSLRRRTLGVPQRGRAVPSSGQALFPSPCLSDCATGNGPAPEHRPPADRR